MSVRASGPAEGMSRRCREEGCLCRMRCSAHSFDCNSPASMTGCTAPTGPASRHAALLLSTASPVEGRSCLHTRIWEHPCRSSGANGASVSVHHIQGEVQGTAQAP